VIVKVQMPLMTNESIPQALIYSENHEIYVTTDAVDFREVMGDRPKAFFQAKVLEDGTLEIGDEAEWQEW
jgi:hypothetical protein